MNSELEELGREILGAVVEHSPTQVDRLASFIIEHVDGEPSESEGAVDTAIRIITKLQAEVERLRAIVDSRQQI